MARGAPLTCAVLTVLRDVARARACKHHEYCFTEYHLQYNRKGVEKGYRLGSICTCHEAVMKNNEEPNLGDEGQSALSEQKGTETSSPIRATVIYNFTI